MKKILNLIFALSISIYGFANNNEQTKKDSIIPYGNNPDAGRFYNIRGIKMYVEEYGEGKPLLMIHGNGGSIKSFKKNIPYFAKNYHVIATDSRAHGKSTDNQDSLSFMMMADDEAALLDAMHIDSAYVIGSSDGGIISLEMAIRHPEKVIKFASTGADICPDSSAKAIMPTFWNEEKEFYEANKNKIFTSAEEKNKFKVKMLDWYQPNIQLSELQAIPCPALIICGDHDIIKIEHTVQIYQNIPHAYLWILPNSGHGTLSEHAAEFNEKVNDFFQKPYKDR